MPRKISYSLILITTIIIGHNGVAQQIKVVSSVDRSPLPFATVTNLSHPFIVSSDRNGIAYLRASIGDTLSISYVGYKTAVLIFKGDQIQVVPLLLNQKTLPSITVYDCRKAKEFNYNNFKTVTRSKHRDEFPYWFRGVIWSRGNNRNAKFAIRLSPLKANATLKDFSFWLQKEQQAPGWSIRTPFVISLYEVSDSTNLPGELISDAPIFYFPKKAGKQTITFDSLQVRIPSNGIYLSIQYITNEEYEWKYTSRWKDSGQVSLRDTVITRYGGIIQGLRCKEFELVWYDGIRNEWRSAWKGATPHPNGHGTIKCEATIKYCNDE